VYTYKRLRFGNINFCGRTEEATVNPRRQTETLLFNTVA